MTTPGVFGLPDVRCYVSEASRSPENWLSANGNARMTEEDLTRDAGSNPRECWG